MADCHKCGSRIHKRRDGKRKCRHCGFSPGGVSFLSRSGVPKVPERKSDVSDERRGSDH